MSVSSIPVMCYYNGHIVKTDNDVKYDGNKAFIVPLETKLPYMSNTSSIFYHSSEIIHSILFSNDNHFL